MKEKYLHYLWQNKLLPFHHMSLVSGESFKVIYPGDYNETESGPDFFNAQIVLDGILWNGNVELHVRSSDWYRHGHQHDPAYSNVILHVVHEFDKEVYILEKAIHTIELKNVINSHHYANYNAFFKRKNKILCASQISKLEPIQLVNMQERALIQRLHRKTDFLDEFRGEPTEALYVLLARAMGSRVNQLPFEELARRLPYRKMNKFSLKDREKMLLQTSGLQFPDTPSALLLSSRSIIEDTAQTGTVNPHSWKRGGLRPGSSPEIRVRQFAALIQKLDPELFLHISVQHNLREHFHRHFLSGSKEQTVLKSLTKGTVDLILINAVVPFFWWFGQIRKDDLIVELAYQLLNQIPPEQNSIILKWRKVGIEPENAYETQAMLEIFNEFCFRKKCLSCGIGKTLLGR